MTQFQLRWHRFTHWEYWPVWAVYLPLLPIWLWLALRARSLFFFNASNPGIQNGGMGMESKKAIYDLMPPEVIPATVFIARHTPADQIRQIVTEAGIPFPLIVKPDIGLKGLAVEKISDMAGIVAYADRLDADFLVQELVRFPLEVGIFYVRMPDAPKGRITGIVYKDLLRVTGDGRSTLLELIQRDPRSQFQLTALTALYGDRLQDILPMAQIQVLVPYGSHTRGAMFIDISDQCTPELEALIDRISQQVAGFYFGRIDLRYDNWADLCAGRQFSIIEINGAGSEPTHMYDPGHSLWFGWREIVRHWLLMWRISRVNHRQGHRYMTYQEGRQMLKESGLLEARLKALTLRPVERL